MTCTRIGPPTLRPYGTNLVAAGTDLRTAQTLLRHQNLNTIAIYVQVYPKRVEAIDRLNPFAVCRTPRGRSADMKPFA